MHFHLPKPVHGWREFAGEVGIIVVGVLIALGAEQVVETVHWSEKVKVAQGTVSDELNQLLVQSYEVTEFHKCTATWVDAAESAIKRQDSAALQVLYDGPPPFAPRNWRSTAWQSMMSTQVADHLDKAYLSRQAFLFSSFEDLRVMIPPMLDNRAEVLSGRLGFSDQATSANALVAAERLRSQLELYNEIAATMLEESQTRVDLPQARKLRIAERVAGCEAAARSARQR